MTVIKTIEELNFQKLSAERVGLILTCNVVDLLFHNYYYRINEKLYSYYVRIPTSPNSVFAERFEELSLKIHESGMKQHWLLNFEGMKVVREREYNREDFMMNLSDMEGAFYCLGIGCVAALLVFLLETFYNECLQYLTWYMVVGHAREKYRRWIMRNVVVPHRFVQVQPRVDGLV